MPNGDSGPTGIEYIMKLSRGFWESALILSANEVGLFEALANGPRTAQEVAHARGTDLRATTMVLDALVALKVLTKEDGRYTNTEAAQAVFVPGGGAYMGDMMRHSLNMWDSWGNLANVLRTGSPVPREGSVAPLSDEHRTRNFIRAMYQGGVHSAEILMDRLDLSRVRRMLDVGGGPGHYCFAAARRNPSLHATVFDLPRTLTITREYIKEHGMEDRVDTVAGDFNKDELPRGFDLVLMSQVLHSNTRSECAALVAKGYASLNPGGHLVINEFALDEDRTSPVSAALFSVNMLANTAGGSAYTRAEITEWMETAGLEEISTMDLGGRSTVFVGLKPAA